MSGALDAALTASGVHMVRSMAGLRVSVQRFAHSMLSIEWSQRKDVLATYGHCCGSGQWRRLGTICTEVRNQSRTVCSAGYPPCAKNFNSPHESLILFRRPAPFHNVGCHLCKPPFTPVFVGPIGNMLRDSMPLGWVGVVGVFCKEHWLTIPEVDDPCEGGRTSLNGLAEQLVFLGCPGSTLSARCRCHFRRSRYEKCRVWPGKEAR